MRFNVIDGRSRVENFLRLGLKNFMAIAPLFMHIKTCMEQSEALIKKEVQLESENNSIYAEVNFSLAWGLEKTI